MSVIINIDTAVDHASVCLAEEGKPLLLKESSEHRESAAWLHPAMLNILLEAGIQWADVSAVAVSAGPGSYTGLRVSMAAAKGICYAMNIPLIFINTLKMMAFSAAEQTDSLRRPMIDARRMEVFTAVYNQQLEEVIPVSNVILDESTFENVISVQPVTFFGNGSLKFRPLVTSENAFFLNIMTNALHMAQLSFEAFTAEKFENVAYSEPNYGKDFYSPLPKKSIY